MTKFVSLLQWDLVIKIAIKIWFFQWQTYTLRNIAYKSSIYKLVPIITAYYMPRNVLINNNSTFFVDNLLIESIMNYWRDWTFLFGTFFGLFLCFWLMYCSIVLNFLILIEYTAQHTLFYLFSNHLHS